LGQNDPFLLKLAIRLAGIIAWINRVNLKSNIIMKKLINLKLIALLIVVIGAVPSYGQGFFKYHYIVPPDLGNRMSGIKRIALLDFTYVAPVVEDAHKDDKEYDAGDELVKILVEKEKKELLGEEEYNKLQAANRGIGNEMGLALASNMTSIMIIPDRGRSPGFKFLIDGMRTDVYTIVDRATIDKVLNEQQFQVSGVVDSKKMSEVGVLMGADAIVSGDMISTKTDEQLAEVRKEVTKPEKYIGEDGKEKTRYVFDYYTYSYPVRRTVRSTFQIKVVSVKTGAILGTETFNASVFDEKSRLFKQTRPTRNKYPQYSELESTESLVRKTVNPLSQSAANMLSPRFAVISMKISKVKAKEFKKNAKEAADFLKSSRIEKAFPMYKAIYDADPYITEAAFNLGMIYEATGQYDAALEYYQAARESAVKNSNEKKYDNAILRAERGVEVVDLLDNMDIKLTKQYFSAAGGEALMAEKVQTRGNPKKDRFNIFESADAGSTIIGKVPGGREFPSFKVEGSYTLIEIVGGKRGYIKNENLK
jgi:curli production assembly/transport component CsgG